MILRKSKRIEELETENWKLGLRIDSLKRNIKDLKYEMNMYTTNIRNGNILSNLYTKITQQEFNDMILNHLGLEFKSNNNPRIELIKKGEQNDI